MNVLVTGANGFVGQALVKSLLNTEHNVISGVRKYPLKKFNCEYRITGSLEDNTRWTNVLNDIDIIVHLAARVHVMKEQSTNPLSEFRKVNVEGTLDLARQAAAAGVKRFIFISSIKVNGEETELGKPYTAESRPSPVDPYGISKYEAEQALLALAQETGLEVSIVRPVLVYGPNVRANFLNMMKWVEKGVPLPFGAIHNKRSIVALDNLVDLVLICAVHPAAINQVFFASDGNDLSTTQMIQQLGTAFGKPARLIPIPMKLLSCVFTLLGKKSLSQRLCSSLQVDISKNKRLLGWTPPVSVNVAMYKTARSYNDSL